MGWRAKAQQAREAVKTAAEDAVKNERVQHLKQAAAGELRELDMPALRDAASASAGATNRKGDVKKWRVAKAAATPAGTAGKVARGVSSELLRQRRERHATTGDDAPEA